jgi:hypothetical protein
MGDHWGGFPSNSRRQSASIETKLYDILYIRDFSITTHCRCRSYNPRPIRHKRRRTSEPLATSWRGPGSSNSISKSPTPPRPSSLPQLRHTTPHNEPLLLPPGLPALHHHKPHTHRPPTTRTMPLAKNTSNNIPILIDVSDAKAC